MTLWYPEISPCWTLGHFLCTRKNILIKSKKRYFNYPCKLIFWFTEGNGCTNEPSLGRPRATSCSGHIQNMLKHKNRELRRPVLLLRLPQQKWHWLQDRQQAIGIVGRRRLVFTGDTGGPVTPLHRPPCLLRASHRCRQLRQQQWWCLRGFLNSSFPSFITFWSLTRASWFQ